jgi:hypothetical protein
MRTEGTSMGTVALLGGSAVFRGTRQLVTVTL